MNSPVTATFANSTADRVIEILLLFSFQKPTWTAVDLAAHLDMPRSTVYRYLTSLKNAKMIVEHGDGVFKLGPKIQVLASVGKSSIEFASVAREEMLKLLERFNENVLFNELVDLDVVSIERVESRHRIRLSLAPGGLLPWPGTATSKLLLAYAEPALREQFWSSCAPQAFTPHTIVDKQALATELTTIAERGYAYSIEERDVGVVAVAVPVRSEAGYKHSLSVVAPRFRVDLTALDDIRQVLLESAKTISHHMM